ncbi:Calycin-like protein [Ilyonectria destructans]|nr:Calycin-like protein [Ilyonectria destructans]
MGIEDLMNTRVQYHYTEGIDWSYELFYRSPERLVYRVVTGPLAGRTNYVRAWYQEIIPKRMYKISWMEETGTIVSQIIDLVEKKVWTWGAFSKGHHENRDICQGKKMTHLDQWRELAKIGIQTDRHVVCCSGIIDEILQGPGDKLPVIEDSWPTL